MALTIYGSPRSRTMRTFWMAEELELDYRLELREWDDSRLKSPEFLAMNPAGAIPTIIDDGDALAESLAINLYLAKKYDRAELGFYARTAIEEAAIWQWTLFAQGHLEPWVQKEAIRPEFDSPIGEHVDWMISRSLRTLDMALARAPWLVGMRFTVADMNAAGVLSPSRSSRLDLTDYTNVSAWLARCYDRPAARRARERYSG